MRVQYYFAFYFLLFLNFLHQILSTNSIIAKMDEFHEEFEEKFKKLSKIKIRGKKSIEMKMNPTFDNAMFKEEFLTEIKNAKGEVEKYLEEKITLTDIIDVLEKLKLKREELVELKKLVNEKDKQIAEIYKNYHRLNPDQEHSVKTLSEQCRLIELLAQMREDVNKFMDKIIEELLIHNNEMIAIHRIKDLLIKLYPFIEQIAHSIKNINKSFEKFVKKKHFTEIENFIISAKKELKEVCKQMPLPGDQFLPPQLKNNKKKLKEAIFNPLNPLLEKVNLNKYEIPNQNLFGPIAKEMHIISNHFVNCSGMLDKKVDQLHNDFINGFFNDGEKDEFDSLRAEIDDDFQSMNIAIDQMYNRIGPLVYQNDKLSETMRKTFLADIHWLMLFIEEKMDQMKNGTTDFIPNMDIANNMEKLTEELAMNRIIIDPKKKAIFIAQNLLFIAGQLNKLHNLQSAADDTLMANPITMSSKDSRLKEMIVKKMIPQNVVQFFYQKYEEWIIVEKHDEYELLKKMEQIKIEEMVKSAKIAEHHSAGGSSSGNLGGNERK